MDSAVDEPSLMEKWRAHWNTRDRIFKPPPEAANRMGVTLFWASNITLMYTTLCVTAARDDDEVLGVSCYWWRVIAWFLCFQTSYNWFLTSLKVGRHYNWNLSASEMALGYTHTPVLVGVLYCFLRRFSPPFYVDLNQTHTVIDRNTATANSPM